MKKMTVSIVAVACLMCAGTYSFADEMGKMKDEMKGHEMKGEMKAMHNDMKAKKDEIKSEMKMKKNEMNSEMKMKKDAVKSDMKGDMKGSIGY